eukprot:537939-Prorocentrum_minimum.AAC.2
MRISFPPNGFPHPPGGRRPGRATAGRAPPAAAWLARPGGAPRGLSLEPWPAARPRGTPAAPPAAPPPDGVLRAWCYPARR